VSDHCVEGHDFEVWRGRDICINCGYTDTPGLKEPAMEHDPKCPAINKQRITPILCTFCQIIRSVREEYEIDAKEIEGYPV
jgi:hypothetical protein